MQAIFFMHGLRGQLFEVSRDGFILADRIEQFSEMLAAHGLTDKILIQVRQDIDQLAVGDLLDFVEDLLVALLGHDALLRVAVAVRVEQPFADGLLAAHVGDAVADEEELGAGLSIKLQMQIRKVVH